jgi:hypothetical protein
MIISPKIKPIIPPNNWLTDIPKYLYNKKFPEKNPLIVEAIKTIHKQISKNT